MAKLPIYDAVVIGSGASGGWACKRLAEAGLKIALLDAGPPQSDQNFTEHMPAFQLKYRNLAPEIVRKTRPRQSETSACNEYTYEWFCNDIDEPYTTFPDMPFSWAARMRIGGGRTNVWGRLCLRYSDLDFKAASIDGYGVDWPFSYKDIEPYYDLVETYVGIQGQHENDPYIPDGIYQPPMEMTCSEALFREQAKKKLGRTVTPGRTANLTRPLNSRPPCHYCGPCTRGCVTHSYFNSAFTTVPDALKTGNCTYIPNAMVHKVLMDPQQNRAKGVLYIDRNTREPIEISGRAVLLCAQAFESVRILFNSATRQHPGGLGNSSGVLGHYVMDHIAGAGADGEFEQFREEPRLSQPVRPSGIYTARFRNLPSGPKSQFLRGYGFEGRGNSGFSKDAPGFGEAYKRRVAAPSNNLNLSAFCEVLARWDNFVDIDPGVVDTFGIPVLRFHMTHGENGFAVLKDASESAAEMLEAAGAKNVKPFLDPTPPGGVRHEVGVARMGNDPKSSVLNQFQQLHDVKNVLVTDASGWCSNPCQNPTLTIMALSVRSCDHLMDEMKKGNI